MRTWQLQEARSRFSELVSEALTQGPQRVTRHGRSAVIIVSEEQWNEITQKVPSFGRMLAEHPLDPGPSHATAGAGLPQRQPGMSYVVDTDDRAARRAP